MGLDFKEFCRLQSFKVDIYEKYFLFSLQTINLLTFEKNMALM
jgi:hypothetical protein